MYNYKNALDFIISQDVPTKNTVNQSQSFSMWILCHMDGRVSAWGQDTGIDRLIPNSSPEQGRSFLGVVVCDLPNKRLRENMSILLTTWDHQPLAQPLLPTCLLYAQPCGLVCACVRPGLLCSPRFPACLLCTQAGHRPCVWYGPCLKELGIKPC